MSLGGKGGRKGEREEARKGGNGGEGGGKEEGRKGGGNSQQQSSVVGVRDV